MYKTKHNNETKNAVAYIYLNTSSCKVDGGRRRLCCAYSFPDLMATRGRLFIDFYNNFFARFHLIIIRGVCDTMIVSSFEHIKVFIYFVLNFDR